MQSGEIVFLLCYIFFMTESKDFESWTSYNQWLIENYDVYSVTNIEDTNGKIKAYFMTKEEWLKEAKRLEAEQN